MCSWVQGARRQAAAGAAARDRQGQAEAARGSTDGQWREKVKGSQVTGVTREWFRLGVRSVPLT